MEFARVHEDLRYRLSRLAEDLKHAQMERAAVEERIRTLEHELRQLEVEEQVLRRVAVRYDIEPPEDGLLPREVEEWRALARTDAILRVLNEAERPMSPGQIEKALAEKGRDDSAHHISAALAYLKDDRALRIGQGQWVAAPERDPSEPSVQLSGIFADNYVKSYQGDTNELAPRPESDAT